MGDPRNVAHAKKVKQEKHHKNAETAKRASQLGKKARAPQKQSASGDVPATQSVETAPPAQTADAAKLEKSLAVLAQLKDLEFHSRANIEKLAGVSLTIEDELKQKGFVESIGAVYSAEEKFHSKISELIEAYQTECDRLQPSG